MGFNEFLKHSQDEFTLQRALKQQYAEQILLIILHCEVKELCAVLSLKIVNIGLDLISLDKKQSANQNLPKSILTFLCFAPL